MTGLSKLLPDGWYESEKTESSARYAELQKELTTGHLLYQRAVTVVAHRDGSDDILCQHNDDLERFTVIHLSWIGRTEINAEHPTVEVDGSFADFLNYENKFG